MYKYLSLILLLFLISSCGKVKKAEIQTNAVCETCEAILQEELEKDNSIKKVKLDLETKVLSVSYNPETTNQADIEKAISEIGYDANEVKANPEAHAKLPYCCQAENKVPSSDKVHKETLEKRENQTP